MAADFTPHLIPEQFEQFEVPLEEGSVYAAACAALEESFPRTAPWVVKQMLSALMPVIVGRDAHGHALYRILSVD